MIGCCYATWMMPHGLLSLQQLCRHIPAFLLHKKTMALPIIMTGINGALGLYSTVKGLIDSSKSNKEQQGLLNDARNADKAWYQRNYYANFMDDKASKAAMKRVENSLRRFNQQERARGIITGATPEVSIARAGQGLRSMENVVDNLAAMDSNRKMNIDASYRQGNWAMLDSARQNRTIDDTNSLSMMGMGYNLIQNALKGVAWGKEERSVEDGKGSEQTK